MLDQLFEAVRRLAGALMLVIFGLGSLGALIANEYLGMVVFAALAFLGLWLAMTPAKKTTAAEIRPDRKTDRTEHLAAKRPNEQKPLHSKTRVRAKQELIEDDDDDGPTEADQLRLIREYHGVLPRKITYNEAEDVIAFLEEHRLPCPFCNAEIWVQDDKCLECGRSLKKMRIPIELD